MAFKLDSLRQGQLNVIYLIYFMKENVITAIPERTELSLTIKEKPVCGYR